jgi:gliding motility-associated-like protein
MKYIKNIFFLIFLFMGIITKSQTTGLNLVNNYSFEDYYQCPFSLNQLIFAKNWWGFHTDYLNICGNIYCGIPYNTVGYQYPKTGVAYAHFVIYTSQIVPWKEYIKSRLQTKLVKNKRYCTELNISIADRCTENNSPIYLDSIGIYFSHDSILDTYTPLYGLKPQVNHSMIGIDTASWKAIKGSFVADGSEDFFTIGNYSDTVPWPAGVVGGLALFIDDVSVCECSFDINLGADTMLCEGETIILNPNLPNATYTWQDSSHAATYEVKQPGTYWVRAYVADYDVYSSDTIVITQGDDSFCNPPLTIPNVITPNGDGANDNFVIQNAESYTITLQIYNRWGRLIYENTNYQNDFSCKTCASGVYYYVIKAKSKRNGKVKEYKGSLTIVNGY